MCFRRCRFSAILFSAKSIHTVVCQYMDDTRSFGRGHGDHVRQTVFDKKIFCDFLSVNDFSAKLFSATLFLQTVFLRNVFRGNIFLRKNFYKLFSAKCFSANDIQFVLSKSVCGLNLLWLKSAASSSWYVQSFRNMIFKAFYQCILFLYNAVYYRHWLLELNFLKLSYRICSLENEIQLAGYKILNALWVIGTQGTRFVDR